MSAEEMDKKLEFQIGEEEANRRLDQVLVGRFPGLGRSSARRLMADGGVRLNGRVAKKGVRVCVGDEVHLRTLPVVGDFSPKANPDLELVIRLEDPDFLVVDKPAGQPTHILRAHEDNTLVNALIARYPELEGVGYALKEPGILHRLDNDTSGLLLVARNQDVFEILRHRLKAGEIDKRYLALVEGEVPVGEEIRYPLGSDPRGGRRVVAYEQTPEGEVGRGRRAACTRVLRASTGQGQGPLSMLVSLVEVEAKCALRHQIRAHLSAIGSPLIGDLLYGGPVMENLSRHFLHASYISFAHPRDPHAQVAVHSPLPKELSALLAEQELALS